MAKALPKDVMARIQRDVFKKADEYCYTSRGRVENGRFMDELVDDPKIGGIIKEYVQNGKVRTYIKDGILNAYTKQKTKQVLISYDPLQIMCQAFGVKQASILSHGDIIVCRSANAQIFIISRGTVLKWETALREGLEYIARTSGVRTDGRYPSICLQLAVINHDITEGDKTQMIKALEAVGVRVFFCSA